MWQAFHPACYLNYTASFLAKGMLYGCAMFMLALLMIDCVFDASLTVYPHQYSRIIFGAVCIGIGFMLSSLIYEEDRLPFFARTLIHLLICAFTILIAFIISGGIPDGTGFGTGTVFVVTELAVGALFWLVSFICFFREARKLKKKLLEQCDN